MFRNFTDVTRPALTEDKSPAHNRVYICDYCSEGWSSETEVEIHRANSHKAKIADMMKDEEKAICKMCMTEFPDNTTLICHIKTEHLLSSKTAIRVERDIFICAYCGDIFFNKSLLTHHILKSHMQKKNCVLTCPVCLKKILLNTCWYHFLKHKLQSVAVCKICLTKHKDRLTLAEHVRSHPYNYTCDTCSYVTKKKELFDDHIRRVHKKCTVNDEPDNDNWMSYFMPRKQVKTWQRINLMGWKGVKLTNDIHICILCREICIGEAGMKQHFLVDHMVEQTTISIYPCECGMVFTSKVLYKHHLFKFKDHQNI